MEQMTAISVIMLLPSNDKQVVSFTKDVINSAQNGLINQSELDNQIKMFEKVIRIIRKELK